MSVKTFAAIDVGSFELTMKIFDFSGKNTMREIDCIRQRIDLGSDTYANGKISNEKMDDLCHTLKEFAQIMESYKVIAYKAYGTSAIRETENTLILQDQIEQRTGIRVEILSNSEQRFLDYKSIASKGETFRRIIEEKTAILDIGGGSIQISLFDKDTLVSTQNLRLGVLRLQELLNHLNAGSTQMEQLVDELATAQLDDYKKLYLKDREIKNIIIVDDYLSPWAVRKAHERGDGNAMVDSKAFDQLMEALRTRGTTELAKRMDIAEEKVPLVYISAVLTKRIAELMGAALIWAPGVTLCDGIAYEYAFATNKPVLFVDTPMKVMNPEYQKIDTVPINIWMRDVIGDRLDPAKTEETESKVRNLLEQKDAYHDKIEKIVEEYVYNLGNSAEVGAKYIVQAVQEQIKKAKEQ